MSNSVLLSENGSSDSDDSQAGLPEARIRVGSDYQVQVPAFPDPDKLPDEKVDEFVDFAMNHHKYSKEQALGMLFWHEFDLESALVDLPTYSPFPDEWSAEDKTIFEQSFEFYGKNFSKIRNMMPDKSVESLVKFYYSWKKTRLRSVVDCLPNGTNTESDDNSDSQEYGVSASSKYSSMDRCPNCSRVSSQLHPTAKGSLCNPCYIHWRRTGLLRAGQEPSEFETRPGTTRHEKKGRSKPPHGIYIDRNEVVAMATGPPDQSEKLMQNLDQQARAAKAKRHFTVSQAWTTEELSLAVQGIRHFGRDFRAIAESLGTKNERQVQAFYDKFNTKYDFEKLVAMSAVEQIASNVGSFVNGGGSSSTTAVRPNTENADPKDIEIIDLT